MIAEGQIALVALEAPSEPGGPSYGVVRFHEVRAPLLGGLTMVPLREAFLLCAANDVEMSPFDHARCRVLLSGLQGTSWRRLLEPEAALLEHHLKVPAINFHLRRVGDGLRLEAFAQTLGMIVRSHPIPLMRGMEMAQPVAGAS